MRWKHKPSPKIGDTKIITKFLWLPLTLDGETRWLERVSIKVKLKIYLSELSLEWKGRWQPIHWIDEEPFIPLSKEEEQELLTLPPINKNYK